MGALELIKQRNQVMNIISIVSDLEKCLQKKCKIERKNLEKDGNVIALNNLVKDFTDKKINFTEYLKKFSKIKLNILNSNIRDNLIKCQLKKCYSLTKKTLDVSVGNILKSYNKDEPIYKIAKKLEKYKGKKITYEDIKNIDIESHKRMFSKNL